MKKEIEYLSILKTTLLFLCLLMIFKTLVVQFSIFKDYILNKEFSDYDYDNQQIIMLIIAYSPIFIMFIISFILKIRFRFSWKVLMLNLCLSIIFYNIIHRKVFIFFSITDSNILNSMLCLAFFSICVFYLDKSVIVKKD